MNHLKSFHGKIWMYQLHYKIILSKTVYLFSSSPGLGPGEDDRAAPQGTGVDRSEPGRTLEEERIRSIEPGTVLN